MGKRIASMLMALAVLVVVQAGPASAEVEIQKLGEVFDKATIGGEVNLLYRYDDNPFFTGDDTGFAEIFSRLFFTLEKNYKWTNLSARFAPYYASTVDQDVYSLAKDTEELEVDQAWLKFGALFGSQWDVTIGRQDIHLEKWFVVGDGEAQGAAYWLAFHHSFPFAVKLDGNFDKLKTNIFWARAGDYAQIWSEGPKQDVELAGINLHYDFSETLFVYGGYFRKIDDGGRTLTGFSRDGRDVLVENNTNAFDLGVDATLGNLQLEGEFVFQTGDAGKISGRDRDREAFGGFASATYRFQVKCDPYLRGTYIFYSGDEDPADGDTDAYDPMFHAFANWNRWVIGEATGELHLPNTNKKVWIAEAGFSPLESIYVQLMYLNQKLDENYYLTTATNSDEWADEINLLIDYVINDNLFLHFGFGYVQPGDAAEEIYGDDDSFFAQTWLAFSF